MTSTTEGCPRSLFKYLAPDRVGVLDSAMMRYSPLGAFNDPFEGRPEITAVSTDKQAMETFAEVFPQEARKLYEALPSQMQAAVPFAQFMTLVTSVADAKQAELLEQVRALAPMATARMHRTFDQHLGALCLSEVPDSLLMWSHYGASHTGFVLEFNAHHPHFHQRRSAEDEFRHLRRVLYRETRPSAALADIEAADLFLVKSGHWAYEREWRILRALSEADSVVPADPFPCHLFAFPRDALKAVILGARTLEVTQEAVRAALASHEDFREVQLKKALPDATHFLLRIVGEGNP